MSDVTFTLLDGTEWVVRAYHFGTLEKAREVYRHHERSTRGGDWDFSVWAVSTPEMTDGLVVFCGQAEALPPAVEGEPYPLSYDNARQFALRRARVTIEAFESHPEEGYFEQRDSYGPENPQTIDQEGGIAPWQRK